MPNLFHTKFRAAALWLLLMLQGQSFFSTQAAAMSLRQGPALTPDTSLAASIGRLLSGEYSTTLYFPNSTGRFYNLLHGQAAWIKPANDATRTWAGMLLIDCVLQFGLFHADYHPAELSSGRLHDMLERPASVSNEEKARFDIKLTDALLTFINDLHYGKLNPDKPREQIDAGNSVGLKAEQVLLYALQHDHFLTDIVKVQPDLPAYKALQTYMQQTTLEQEDCYGIPPDSTVRKIVINLERLRWANLQANNGIQINIPSYQLTLFHHGKTNTYRVIAGKPNTPTPTLESQIEYLTTWPRWTVPKKIMVRELLPRAIGDRYYLERNHYVLYSPDGRIARTDVASLRAIRRRPDGYQLRQIPGCDNALGKVVFRFPNIYDIYLHDTPEQSLFTNAERAFSHGCVRVEHAAELAEQLLRNDGQDARIPELRRAMSSRQTKTFSLKKSLPISITYITCTMNGENFIRYPDQYDLDGRLEMIFYYTARPFAAEQKINHP